MFGLNYKMFWQNQLTNEIFEFGVLPSGHVNLTPSLIFKISYGCGVHITPHLFMYT